MGSADEIIDHHEVLWETKSLKDDKNLNVLNQGWIYLEKFE